jgi:hypothetical protein
MPFHASGERRTTRYRHLHGEKSVVWPVARLLLVIDRRPLRAESVHHAQYDLAVGRLILVCLMCLSKRKDGTYYRAELIGVDQARNLP